MEQKSAGEKKKNLFQEFLEEDDTLKRFLQVGMTSTEITNYFDSVNGNGDKPRFVQDMRFHITLKKRMISKRDPDFLAREIGGERLGLKRPNQCRRILLSIRSYGYGNIYFNNNASPYTRIIHEAGDSSVVSNRLKVIGIISEFQPIGDASIQKIFSSAMSYSNYKDIISKLTKGDFIVKDKEETYSIGLKLKTSYSQETKKIWEEFKVWPLRERFYP